MKSKQKVILAILDGFGLAPAGPQNAIHVARKPQLDAIFAQSSTVTLKTSGLDVGLPAGQMGNSEVGHLNIGAGRIVYQDITRIDRMLETGDFFESPALLNLLSALRAAGGALHVLGLLSDGGVHASDQHWRATLEFCRRQKFPNVILHVFTDGRDTPPHSGLGFVRQLERWTREFGIGRIATVGGRYYGMDRDKRWDRVDKAYRALCFGEGNPEPSAEAVVQHSYDKDVTDEFVLPSVIGDFHGRPLLAANDGVFFLNFRADRARQLTDALTDPAFTGFPAPRKVKYYVTMTRYREQYAFPIVSATQSLARILGAEVSAAGLRQFRIAETEKYPHVTFFFNGGEETPFPGEDRFLVQSPRVATYDLQPSMSAREVTDKLLDVIAAGQHELIVVNFANCDMVGHTGVLAAAVAAVETVDAAVGRMRAAAAQHGYDILLTADHGNAEEMWDPSTNGPHTAHTTNLVPLALISADSSKRLRDGGRLADLAPTILRLLDLPQPPEMTGQCLLVE
ncbi:2,3-bisphosphoglycerate-independent phosphoglycerate mutase [candidate division KSB1 bacterium]|nr:2,3-bisphosphoglycerate-independent phosphoglycerate mutase [candidate division KSB1 bacterium]